MELLKGECPEYIDLIDSIHFMTNVSGNKLSLFITTSNDLLIQIGELCSEYLDRILGTPFDLYYYTKHEFNFDVSKFIDSTSDYTFYEAITKNTKTNIKWQGHNFKNKLKSLLKAHKAFDQLWYDKADPPSVMLIGLLHLDSCDLDLTFDNSEFVNPEMESKGMILSFLKELIQELTEK